MAQKITENLVIENNLDLAAGYMSQYLKLHGGSYKEARLAAAKRYNVDAELLKQYARKHNTKANFK